MSEDIELRLLREIEELKRELKLLKGIDENQIPTYSFSKIRDKELKELFDIKKSLNPQVFDNWFNNDIEVSTQLEDFTFLFKSSKEMKSMEIHDHNCWLN
jgi:hypothetical protein